MRTREAKLPDAERIHDLISVYSGDGTLLPRTFAEICEMSAILWFWCETDESSAAARFTSMASISLKYAPSRSIPPSKAPGVANNW